MLASRSLMISRAAVLSPRVAFGKSALSAPIRAARITTTTPVARATAGGVNDPDAAKATLDIDPFAKSARLGRPMSPHLTIYKWELTMIASVAHRATGAGVAALFYFGSIWYGISPYHSADVVNLVHSLPNEALIAGKVILASPLVYHSLNGIRHLNWDTGRALDVNSVFNTGYVVLAGTAVGTAYLALHVPGGILNLMDLISLLLWVLGVCVIAYSLSMGAGKPGYAKEEEAGVNSLRASWT